MRNRQQASFATITSEGALLPLDILQKIALLDNSIRGLDGESYKLDRFGIKLNEAISASWGKLLRAWQNFENSRAKLRADENGLTLTREKWLLPLFQELGYGELPTVKPFEIEGKSYPISHGKDHLPMHLVSLRSPLDAATRDTANGFRFSPYSLVQEFLNRSPEHLWGLVSNGFRLRLLRKNATLTRQAYVEFNLEDMFTGENYTDFALFWLLCHQSRLESEHPAECWLERWSRLAQEQGVRVLNQLRNGVEEAINLLGAGFLAHRNNTELKEKLRSGTLKAQDYYTQVLRLVYRLLILFVAEDRDILFVPGASQTAKDRYAQYYSTSRLRRMAGLRLGTRHTDLFRPLWLVMEQLGNDTGSPALGLPSLNGFLFNSRRSMPELIGCELENSSLLAAMRALAYTEEKAQRRTVDYKNLGAEELGSVYESLLELHPQLNVESATFKLVTVSGNTRKTTGSYYTPTSLIDCLLDSALDPVLAEACAKPDPEAAILALKVCDPACGSGHFLIAAAHRIAKRLAAVRTGTEEPGQQERRNALRDVISHCIYGVDINPMAVEICKVALWMEAIVPGKPLSFLDAHIKCGNSLLGTTPALLRGGIPDEAFEPIEGDDKEICRGFKKKNKELRAGQISWIREDLPEQLVHQGTLMNSIIELDRMGEDTAGDIRSKEQFFADVIDSEMYQNALLWANTWCAAFVWKKMKEMVPPITHEEFREIGYQPKVLAAWRRDEIKRLAEQYNFFHWHLAFPDVFRVTVADEPAENEQAGWSGGFDVVLGNPPWEHTELKEQEWFTSHDAEIANAVGAERKRRIDKLATRNPELYQQFLEARRQENGWSHFVRDSDQFPLCGRGRINTYAIFAEYMSHIISSTGQLGCIVPSGIATDDTTKLFFKDLIESHRLASLYSFENEEFIFPAIHHSIRFCLLTIAGINRSYSQTDFIFFARQTEDLQEEWRHFSLSSKDITLFNPNTKTCPIFSSRKDAELSKLIYRKIPIFINENNSIKDKWDIRLRQGIFNMTSDSGLFSTIDELESDKWELRGNTFHKNRETFLPLFEAKMVSLFDHRYGTYEGQTQAQANQGKLPEFNEDQHADPHLLPIPHYWVHASKFSKSLQGHYTAFLGFRDVARAKDMRTAVFCILPVIPCNHKLPLMIIDEEQMSDLLYLQSCFASFVFDYAARQKLGGASFGFFILKQLPVLPPSTYAASCPWSPTQTLGDWIAPRALELTYTAWDLEAFAKDCGYDGPPFRWDEERRFLLRCELDAAYFHLYEIARDDVEYIMDTFRVWKEKEEKHLGEYRAKRVILEIYDDMLRASQSGRPEDAYRARLEPGPADPAVAHEARVMSRVEGD